MHLFNVHGKKKLYFIGDLLLGLGLTFPEWKEISCYLVCLVVVPLQRVSRQNLFNLVFSSVWDLLDLPLCAVGAVRTVKFRENHGWEFKI